MGGHEGRTRPNGCYPDGLLPDQVASVTRVLDQERWLQAEERTAELIACIQPNQISEDRRNAVARYMKGLITKCFPCQVFTFGSVPLKTYLPDGDIDLSAFSYNQNSKENWANEVLEILRAEEKSEDGEFRVKEVQYINAEVKIIKCLVANVVVDISINQLGGLCTLCFLEEVDNVINNNHLFKRSIILIKAWCYYESRILGAHHGLMSTYALETLVLYIFHVYNNSFAGPLEVLYRFLEFFSQFDWDTFCVSLWGPVPISSLPNMTVDPPRNDVGELSLSKLVYACMSSYTVLPQGEENLEQPFISKHFNIIDPLRMNNNLGRSVSKGNFFRIRSAFAFGAQRLARLLDCPKENLIAELNEFFMNTWDRHGKGHRPDAPSPDFYDLQSDDYNKNDRPNIFDNNLGSTKNGVTEKSTGYELKNMLNCSSQTPLGVSSQHGKLSLVQLSRTPNVSAVSHTENLKAFTNSTNSVLSTQKYSDLQIISSNQNTQADRGRNSRSGPLRNEVLVPYQLVRTNSSPELRNAPGDVSFGGRNSRESESGNVLTVPVKSDNGRCKKLNPQVLGNQSAKFSTEDRPSSSLSSSHQSIDASVDSYNTSNSYCGDFGMDSMGKGCHSVAETMQMHQEEQDFVNMMASKCNINGQVQMQVRLSSSSQSLPIPPPVLTSVGYGQKNLAGTASTNIPDFESPWVSNLHYSEGLFSLPRSQYYQGIGMASKQEEMTKLVDSNLISKELNQADNDVCFWQQQNAHSLRGYDCSNRSSRSKGSNSSRGNNFGSYSLEDHRLHMDKGGVPVGMYGDNSPCERIWESDVNSGASSKCVSSQPIPSRIKLSLENIWDGSPSRPSKSMWDKHGRKSVSSTDDSITEGLDKNGCRNDAESADPVSSQAVEDRREQNPPSTAGTDVVESSVSGSVTSSYFQTHLMPSCEPLLVNGSNSVLPVTSVLVNSESQQTATKNQGVLPFPLYPVWPGVPFLTMRPVYSLPTERRPSSVPKNHCDGDEEFDNFLRESDLSMDSAKSIVQSKVFDSNNSVEDVTSGEPSEQQKTDILDSDRVSHLQNLQYGLFCQNAGLQGPLLHPAPVMRPLMYPQEHFRFDNPGRPPAENINLFTQLWGYTPGFVHVSSLQPDSSQPVGVYEHHRDEIPRYRSGTGTHFSSHKSSFCGQKSSNTRNRMGSYGSDRKDHVGEREGGWNTNSRPRFAAHCQGHNQVEKPNRKMDRRTARSKQSGKSCDSFEHDDVPSDRSHGDSLSISNSTVHGSANVASGMYPLPVVNSTEVSPCGTALPSLVMLYPYDQNMGYSSPAEQFEFGSLGAVCFSGIGEASHNNEGLLSVADEQQDIQDDSELSSPDQPASPQPQRRA